jgi:hypothetical protein
MKVKLLFNITLLSLLLSYFFFALGLQADIRNLKIVRVKKSIRHQGKITNPKEIQVADDYFDRTSDN